MPIPKPRSDEDQRAWLQRCMGNPTMREEFPDDKRKQRAAVCHDIWRRRDEKAAGFLDLEVKFSEPSDAGEFSGYASVFGETDLLGDQVMPGAFKKSLAAHKRAGRWPLMLWSHDFAQPIGKWTEIRETAEGLFVKGKLLLDVARAREVYALLREKVIDGLSIGFRTVQAQRMKTGGRRLEAIDLAEISLVTMPALASARVTTVKSQPRREPAHPVKETTHVARIVSAGRRAGPIRISSRSIAGVAARARRADRNQGR